MSPSKLIVRTPLRVRAVIAGDVAPAVDAAISPAPAPPPASMAAPPAPTAAEWAFAAGYKLKNSKGYRYYWGVQVRSMMGPAVEGPGTGYVRFHVEIAPDGKLAKLETLWSTSDAAERLARQAIEHMPSLPPTPSGQPLVFERTISLTTTPSGFPPIYRDDCLPDPPPSRDAFVWDGKSPLVYEAPKPVEKPDPAALAECLKQLPQDSVEAEAAHGQQEINQWESSDSKH